MPQTYVQLYSLFKRMQSKKYLFMYKTSNADLFSERIKWNM